MLGGVRSCECVLACVFERERKGAREIWEGECCIKYVCVRVLVVKEQTTDITNESV